MTMHVAIVCTPHQRVVLMGAVGHVTTNAAIAYTCGSHDYSLQFILDCDYERWCTPPEGGSNGRWRAAGHMTMQVATVYTPHQRVVLMGIDRLLVM